MAVLNVIDRILKTLLGGETDIKIILCVTAAIQEEVAADISADRLRQLAEQDHVAGALTDAKSSAVFDQVDHLHQQRLKPLTG